MGQILKPGSFDEGIVHVKRVGCGLGIRVMLYGLESLAVLGLGLGLGIQVRGYSSVWFGRSK